MDYRVHELATRNRRSARRLWKGTIARQHLIALDRISERFHLSLEAGDLLLLDGKWYVTHSGLLNIAEKARCSGITVEILDEFCSQASKRWVFKATVYKRNSAIGFIGYGDADPTNVSPLVRGAEMRVAETRAVNRALRKAYGIGLCSVEEIGAAPPRPDTGRSEPPKHAPNPTHNGNGHSSTLRDRLTLLIRQHQLDPGLVKLYAADFCGVHELRSASRELVEDFVTELATQAATDRDSLLCKLNSYARKQQEGAA